jgi:hypothetical protein
VQRNTYIKRLTPHKGESKMKRFVSVLTLMLALCFGVSAQLQPVSQSFTESVTVAPPAVNTAQSFSNVTNTGIQLSQTGGSIAAGVYRVGVTYYTATSTESPLSGDTLASATFNCTTGTCSVIIQPPITSGVGLVGSNVVGWRMYVGAANGASGAETLQTINNTVCTLASNTAACSLQSPATFTASTNFSAGSGGPASPGTAIYPPITNAANQAIFENSQYQFHTVYWVVSGTAPSACTFNLQTGATIAGLANVGQTITCTTSGSYSYPSNATAAYSAVNLATFTAGGVTTSVTFYETILPFNPMGNIWFTPVAPTSACGVGASGFVVTAAVPSTLYTCVTTTWTAVTLP